ncbi:MAG: methylmalonyl-CoA mutase family protein [Elusimicrobiota bacterium]
MSENDFTTPSGIEIQRVYDTPDTRDPEYVRTHLGNAGEPPFTRGVQKTMYRGRLWTMRQYAGFGTAAETNERFRWLLEQGQTGLSVAFDLPTQMGYDADHPKAAGEVGRVGVHAGTLDDMRTLFKDIPLKDVSTSMTVNSTAAVLMSMVAAVAEEQGVAASELRGTVQNDILKEHIARGTHIFPVAHGMRLAVDTIEYCTRNMPKWNTISISGYHIREAGADAVQELAFTFADAEAYVRALVERGMSVDEFGPRLAFFFGCHSHFLEEIAKFRAARRLWHRIMTEEFKAKEPKAAQLRFHVQTCGSTLTSQQPMNNVMRVALQAMAAVLGGCQSLHTNSFDEALALPTEESVQIALRTQQILACETGVTSTVDPLGGAYAVEALTDQLEEKALERIREIRSMGGMMKAVADGMPQREIQESAYRAQKAVENGRREVVGLNCYKIEEKARRGKRLKVSPALEARQRRSLTAFRKKRDGAASSRSLGDLAKAAKAPRENLFPHILRCVESGATLGEVCGSLREVFGEDGI